MGVAPKSSKLEHFSTETLDDLGIHLLKSPEKSSLLMHLTPSPPCRTCSALTAALAGASARPFPAAGAGAPEAASRRKPRKWDEWRGSEV
jgi:hypothetical protein